MWPSSNIFWPWATPPPSMRGCRTQRLWIIPQIGELSESETISGRGWPRKTIWTESGSWPSPVNAKDSVIHCLNRIRRSTDNLGFSCELVILLCRILRAASRSAPHSGQTLPKSRSHTPPIFHRMLLPRQHREHDLREPRLLKRPHPSDQLRQSRGPGSVTD